MSLHKVEKLFHWVAYVKHCVTNPYRFYTNSITGQKWVNLLIKNISIALGEAIYQLPIFELDAFRQLLSFSMNIIWCTL